MFILSIEGGRSSVWVHLWKYSIHLLKNRKQFAIVNGCTSQTKNVCCGEPQGSLLGPRFFSYYVNNLPDAVTEGELAMYADDTTLSVVGDNVEVVIDKLNKALASINLWCRNSKSEALGRYDDT